MRTFTGKLMLRIAVGLVILVVGLLAWGYFSLARSVAPDSGRFLVEGIRSTIEIRLDEYQRPFVTAEVMEDALFAQGWLHASHRLFQMELFRRAGKGRLSELLGTGLLDTDRELWRTGVPQLAQRLEANAAIDTRTYINSYVAGINAAIEARTSSPPEFRLLRVRPEPWTPSDVYALGALMAFQTSNNANNELLRLTLFEAVDDDHASIFLPDDGDRDGHPYVIPRTGAASLVSVLERRDFIDPAGQPLFPSFALGSNGWAVSPERSSEGVALFAFDSHDSLAIPNLMYEVHLFFEEGKEIRGWSVAGLPGVINGFNERIAWGFTTIGDSQDLFIETRSDSDPLMFLDDGEWYRAEVETVEIPVKGQREPEVLEIIHTRNGPLISEEPPIALRWAVTDLRTMGLDALLHFNRAQDWDEFHSVMNHFPAPALAATYADIDGNIGFRVAGLLPVRRHGRGLFPLPGDDPAMRWLGMIQPSTLPSRYNPPEGFVAAANARVNPEGQGPLVSADNAPGYRIRRIQEVLAERDDFTLEDMRALQMDWHDGQAALVLPALLSALDGASLGSVETRARDALRSWARDPVAKPDQPGGIIFQAWYKALVYEIFEPGLSPELFERWIRATYPVNHAVDRLILDEPDNPWWRGEREEVIQDAFRRAVQEIRGQQGGRPELWRLDRMHRVGLEHELGKAVPMLGRFFNVPPEPWGGSPATVGRARYSYAQDSYDVTGAASVRFVGAMGAPAQYHGIMPGGQSGHPWSEHYADQFPLWLNGELLPIPVSPEEVEYSIIELAVR